MAGTTGLEPAASAVTGQRSNQLNYVPTLFSSGFGKPAYLLAFLICHGFHHFHHFRPVSLFLGINGYQMDTINKAAVPALSPNILTNS